MRHSKGFLEGTAKDYDMTVEQVKLTTKDCKTSSEFYDALEQEVESRKRVNKPISK